MRRVAITGAGAISALGRNTSEFAESLREGRGGIGQIESTDITGLRFQNGAEVKNYSHQAYFEDRRADFMRLQRRQRAADRRHGAAAPAEDDGVAAVHNGRSAGMPGASSSCSSCASCL